MARRKRILIDADLRQAAQKYVRACEEIWNRRLADAQFEEVVYKCAVHAQEIRNWERRKGARKG